MQPRPLKNDEKKVKSQKQSQPIDPMSLPLPTKIHVDRPAHLQPVLIPQVELDAAVTKTSLSHEDLIRMYGGRSDAQVDRALEVMIGRQAKIWAAQRRAKTASSSSSSSSMPNSAPVASIDADDDESYITPTRNYLSVPRAKRRETKSSKHTADRVRGQEACSEIVGHVLDGGDITFARKLFRRNLKQQRYANGAKEYCSAAVASVFLERVNKLGEFGTKLLSVTEVGAKAELQKELSKTDRPVKQHQQAQESAALAGRKRKSYADEKRQSKRSRLDAAQTQALSDEQEEKKEEALNELIQLVNSHPVVTATTRNTMLRSVINYLRAQLVHNNLQEAMVNRAAWALEQHCGLPVVANNMRSLAAVIFPARLPDVSIVRSQGPLFSQSASSSSSSSGVVTERRGQNVDPLSALLEDISCPSLSSS